MAVSIISGGNLWETVDLTQVSILQTFLHKVVYSVPRHERDSNSQLSDLHGNKPKAKILRIFTVSAELIEPNYIYNHAK